jgi:acyl-CoA thioesterase II
MGDLAADTAIEPVTAPGGGAGDEAPAAAGERRCYTGTLSPDWAIWGPNGGYVASLALRAAGLATGRARPASIVAHILGVAAFDRVDLDVTVLRTSRFASSARVSMTQGDRPILEALAWGLDPGGAALDHDVVPVPQVPRPDELPTRDERIADIPEDERPADLPFFRNLDIRQPDWRADWPPSGPLDPTVYWWSRFVPTARFADPWVDACRLLVPIDTMGWPAASLAHAYQEPLATVAVTVDLSVGFHRPADDEWLLAEATAPLATGGLVAATGRVWDRAGALVASGGQTMMCRPAPTL